MGKSSQTTTKVYGNTTTSNPYASSTTNNSGTTSSFVQGSALDTVYNFVNKNMDSLLNEYLNPSLNSTTNQAKLNSFTNTLIEIVSAKVTCCLYLHFTSKTGIVIPFSSNFSKGISAFCK